MSPLLDSETAWQCLCMRAARLRPVRIWVPDTRAGGFAAKCAGQAAAIAQHDLAGSDPQSFIDAAYEWPEA